MPVKAVHGVNISFDEYGSGEPVLLITGTGPGAANGRHIRCPR